MMMRMLEAGGISLLIDHVRKADNDNPEGYFEFERVKGLPGDTEWLASAEGKAVKVISMLLRELPANREYKVLFMLREMNEILASQSAMLTRRGESKGPPDADMRKHFDSHLKKTLEWIGRQGHMKMLCCNYGDAIANPRGFAEQVSGFIGVKLDIEKMAQSVRPDLHRQRGKS